MKVYLPFGLNINLSDFLKKNGYGYSINSKTNRASFVKRLTANNYPRFHIYIEKEINGRSYFSLHLDQKEPSYQKHFSHSAEYNSEIVKREAESLKRKLYNTIIYNKNTQNKKTEFSFGGWIKNLFK